RCDHVLEGKPEIQAMVKDSIGNAYRALGFYKEARTFLEASHDWRQKNLPADHLDIALSKHNLAWLYQDLGEYEKAKELYRDALGMRSRLTPNDPSVVRTMFNLAWLLTQMEEFAEAEKMLSDVIEIRTEAQDFREVAIAKFSLAALYLERGDRDLLKILPLVT